MRRFHPKSLQYFSLEHMKRKCLFLLKLSSQIIQSAVFSNADVAGNLARQKSVLMQCLPRQEDLQEVYRLAQALLRVLIPFKESY